MILFVCYLLCSYCNGDDSTQPNGKKGQSGFEEECDSLGSVGIVGTERSVNPPVPINGTPGVLNEQTQESGSIINRQEHEAIEGVTDTNRTGSIYADTISGNITDEQEVKSGENDNTNGDPFYLKVFYYLRQKVTSVISGVRGIFTSSDKNEVDITPESEEMIETFLPAGYHSNEIVGILGKELSEEHVQSSYSTNGDQIQQHQENLGDLSTFDEETRSKYIGRSIGIDDSEHLM